MVVNDFSRITPLDTCTRAGLGPGHGNSRKMSSLNHPHFRHLIPALRLDGHDLVSWVLQSLYHCKTDKPRFHLFGYCRNAILSLNLTIS